MTRPLSSDDIRERFLRFFTARQHLRIAAASVVPVSDPTLLYVNAGMAPLKPYFLGEAIPPAPDLCNVQPCIRTIDMRSSPEPVSTLANRSGSSSPDARRWYSMNTPAFQISMYRPAVSNSPPGRYAGPFAGPVSKNTSVDGPHGPVSPAVQKLSSPSQTMWSRGTPARSHAAALTSSGGTPRPSSPENTVTYSWPGAKPNPSVSRSQASSTARSRP